MVLVKCKNAILRHPVTWFVVFPAIFVVVCSFIFDLRPTAFCEKLFQQFALENSIEALTQRIHSVQIDGYSASAEAQSHLDDLIAQREALQKKFLSYRPSLNMQQEAIETWPVVGDSVHAGEAYRPFLALSWIAMLLLMISATRYRIIPFPLRAFSMVTGSILAVSIIGQCLTTIHMLYGHLLWYMLAGNIFLIIGWTFGMIISLTRFVKYFYKPWKGRR